MDGSTGIGKHHAVVEPHEQLLSEELLEMANLLADGRRRNTQFLGGSDVAPSAGCGFKGAQGVERRQGQAMDACLSFSKQPNILKA